MTKKTYKNVFFTLFSSQNKFGGFTLIELLVVVLIIGILAAVALPKYEVAVAKSRYTQLIIAAENIKKANQVYQMANGHYTMDMHNLDLSITNCVPSDDGRHCLLQQTNRRMVCYLNDGSTDSSGNLRPINYCTMDQMYYASRYDGSKECWAKTDNKVAKQVCLSMGGVFLREGSNGLTDYRLP